MDFKTLQNIKERIGVVDTLSEVYLNDDIESQLDPNSREEFHLSDGTIKIIGASSVLRCDEIMHLCLEARQEILNSKAQNDKPNYTP